MKKNIDNLKTGRELDALVAQNIIGDLVDVLGSNVASAARHVLNHNGQVPGNMLGQVLGN